MEAVRRAVMVGEQQQSEPDLRDEERLRQREEMGDDPARLPPPVVGGQRGDPRSERRHEHEECDRVVRR